MKKASAFILSFFSFLFLAIPAFAYGTTGVGFDGTNYSVSGTTSNPDGSQYCVLEDYGNVFVDTACTVTSGSFTFSWPSSTYTPEANHQLGSHGYNVVVCSDGACSGTVDFVVMFDPHLFDTIPHGLTGVNFNGTNYSVSGTTSNPDGSQYCVLEDYGNVFVDTACTVTSGSFTFSWPSSTYTPEANHQPDHGYNVVVCSDSACSGTNDFVVNFDSHLFDSLFSTNHVPSVGAITASTNPVQVNTSTTASASFTDADTADTHTAQWNWGDGNTTTGTVTESSGSGSVSNNHTYTTAGVYTITLTVTDNHSASGMATYQYLAVFAPTSSGLFTGVRHFDNPTGASPSTTGQVKFGVSMKYDSNNNPTGHVSMNFKNANLDFTATSFDYLVISGAKAYVKGSGTLNGTSGYTFLASGIDGHDTGGSDEIRFQIKQGTTTIYDSQPSAGDDADPTTSLTGQVIVH